jgi:hypothetical protein
MDALAKPQNYSKPVVMRADSGGLAVPERREDSKPDTETRRV